MVTCFELVSQPSGNMLKITLFSRLVLSLLLLDSRNFDANLVSTTCYEEHIKFGSRFGDFQFSFFYLKLLFSHKNFSVICFNEGVGCINSIKTLLVS